MAEHLERRIRVRGGRNFSYRGWMKNRSRATGACGAMPEEVRKNIQIRVKAGCSPAGGFRHRSRRWGCLFLGRGKGGLWTSKRKDVGTIIFSQVTLRTGARMGGEKLVMVGSRTFSKGSAPQNGDN